MYARYEDKIKISLSFCEKQAVRRVVKVHEWSPWDLDVINGALFIGNYNSLKQPLLVLTAHCKVDQDTFQNNGMYVLASALDSSLFSYGKLSPSVLLRRTRSVMDKIKEIWSSEFDE